MELNVFSGAGSNQRKGCLWALNPAKAHKMDEEVQKWSKKDLQGIKDAMTYPGVCVCVQMYNQHSFLPFWGKLMSYLCNAFPLVAS